MIRHILSIIRVFTTALILAQAALADGFRLEWAREHEAHIVMQLTPEQVATVGRERKLVLTPAQRETLATFAKNVPKVLGVESLGEPDCSCILSSALWTDTTEVTIWVRRLAHDKDGSKYYHEIRKKPGYYTADADGRIFAAGKEVKWAEFEAVVLRSTEGAGGVQLSPPPKEPKELTAKLKRLRAKKPISTRL